jgi:hypothetical protein
VITDGHRCDRASHRVRVWTSVLSQIVAAAGPASRSRSSLPLTHGLGSADRTAACLALVGSPNHTPQEGSDEHRVCFLELDPGSARGRARPAQLVCGSG